MIFLQSIRKNKDDPISNEQFAEFLGITSGKTLCFVIDTTGSMADDIAAVQSATINLIRNCSSPQAACEKPSDYLLSPFNDPSKRDSNFVLAGS